MTDWERAVASSACSPTRVAMGADPQQTLRALREAEAYDGPSLVIAYSHCIAHGIEMREGMGQQYRAVASGYWPLIRYDPVCAPPGTTRSCSTRRGRASRWPTTPAASCATASWPSATRPRPSG